MAATGSVGLYLRMLDQSQAEIGRLKQQLSESGRAARQARAEIKGLQTGVSELDKSAGGIGGMFGKGLDQAFGSLKGLLIGGGVAGLVMGVGKLADETARLGDNMQRQRAYFEVWSGSAAKATEYLNAMRAATRGAVAEDEMLAAANKYLSMGLATNAQELQTLANMAIMLGGSTRTATESLDEFALLLSNQSIARLDTFGISSATVRTRIDELTAANKNLTREQAFMDAVMEQGEKKIRALASAGVEATSSFDRLTAARKNFEIAMGGKTSSIADWWNDDLTATLNALTDLLNGKTVQLQPGDRGLTRQLLAGLSPDTIAEQYAAAYERVQHAQDNLTKAMRTGFGVEAATNALNAAQANYDFAKSLFEAQLRAEQIDGPLDWVERRMRNLAEAAKEAGTAVATAIPVVTKSVLNQYGEYEEVPIDLEALHKLYQDDLNARTKVATDAADARLEAEKATNKAAADNWESEYKSRSSRISGLLSQGMSASQALLKGWMPGAGNPMDDPNGPFRDVRRALDVAKLGEASPWFKELGISVEQAQKIASDVNRGLFTKDVEALVDKEAINGLIQAERESEANMSRFADSLNGLANVVDAVSNRLAAKPGGGGAGAGATGTGTGTGTNGTGTRPYGGTANDPSAGQGMTNVNVFAPTYVQNPAALASAQSLRRQARLAYLAERF